MTPPHSSRVCESRDSDKPSKSECAKLTTKNIALPRFDGVLWGATIFWLASPSRFQGLRDNPNGQDDNKIVKNDLD